MLFQDYLSFLKSEGFSEARAIDYANTVCTVPDKVSYQENHIFDFEHFIGPECINDIRRISDALHVDFDDSLRELKKYMLTCDTEAPFGFFRNDDGLTDIVIPSNIRLLGDSCFFGCSNLGTVTIKKGALGSGCGIDVFKGTNVSTFIIEDKSALEKLSLQERFCHPNTTIICNGVKVNKLYINYERGLSCSHGNRYISSFRLIDSSLAVSVTDDAIDHIETFTYKLSDKQFGDLIRLFAIAKTKGYLCKNDPNPTFTSTFLNPGAILEFAYMSNEYFKNTVLFCCDTPKNRDTVENVLRTIFTEIDPLFGDVFENVCTQNNVI